MKKWIVVIADIVDSRMVENRMNLQNRLRTVLEEVNSSSDSIFSPYTITLGDEFQAVLSKSDDLFSNLWTIKERVFPSKLRISIAVGTISTELIKTTAIGMDGNAFYFARDALNGMKESATVFAVSGLVSSCSELINDSMALITDESEYWKKNKIGIQARLLRGASVDIIASDMGISKSAVYQSIRKGRLTLTTRIYDRVAEMIDEEILKSEC
ncbi:MAG: SatD family protein [Candidatus Sabulitectum sp.]|nr:SatD family protein [Candidatus Sabulitectum sp.]